VPGEVGQSTAVSAQRGDVVWETATVDSEQVGGSSISPGGCQPLSGAGDAVGTHAVLELQDVDSPVGRAGLEVDLECL
jgi:hypothetical protein